MRMKAVLRQHDEGSGESSSGAAQAPDRRRSGRRALRLSAAANSHSSDEIPVLVLDISPGGLLLEAEPRALVVDDFLEISLPAQAPLIARVVWQSGRYFGCEFTASISPASISAALLNGDPLTSPFDDDVEHGTLVRSRTIEPELNFSTVFWLALVGWAVIGTGAYLLFW